MDWLLFWTAVGAAILVVSLVAGLFTFIRNNDMSSLNDRLDGIEDSVGQRLLEGEFRRHELREEENFKALRLGTDNKFNQLDRKIDEKFDKLFDMLTKRHDSH